MEELTSFAAVPSTAVEQQTDVKLQALINEVLQDEWCGASNFERATRARAELFSRLRFPKSSIGTPVKKPS